MKQTKTTLKELTAAYRAVLRHGILCNAIALGLIATAPAMADVPAPYLDGTAFVFGDIMVTGDNGTDIANMAFGGRRLGVNEDTGKYLDAFPGYTMYGHSISVAAPDTQDKTNVLYVGPVDLTLGSVEGKDFRYNYQDAGYNDIDIATAEKSDHSGNVNIVWNDANVVGQVASVIGAENAAWTAPGVYMFSRLASGDQATALEGTLSLAKTDAIIDGATLDAKTINITDGSTVTIAKKAGNALDDAERLYTTADAIDSNGKTLLKVDNMNVDSSRIVVNSGAELTVDATEGATFANSTSETNGGAIYNNGTLKLDGATFTGNAANGTYTENGAKATYSNGAGGAIYNAGDLTVGGTFENNTAFSGGAIRNLGTLTVEDSSSFDGNYADIAGGAIYNSGTLNIGKGVTFSDNTSLIQEGNKDSATGGSEMGAAIYSEGTVTSTKTVNIGDGTQFVDNTSAGGALYFYGANNATIGDNVEFRGNTGVNSAALRAANNGSNGFASITIGDNALFTENEGVYASGIMSGVGSTINIGKNAVFSNNTGTAIRNNGTLTFGANATFSGNESTLTNEAGALRNTGTATFDGASFVNNTTNTQGGAIYNSGTLTLNGGKMSNNSATEGGAIFMNAEGLTSTINGVAFENNSASQGDVGGAIGLKRGTLNIEDTTFKGNNAGWAGAIFTYSSGNELNITDSSFEENTALGAGAVTAMFDTNISDTVFKKNQATASTDDGAGALFIGANGKANLNRVEFIENTSAANGGAIATRSADVADNSAAKLDILDSTFTGNVAATTGGALDNYLYSSLADDTAVYISGANFASNQAAKGGAVYNHGEADKAGNIASMKIADSTFTGNIATGQGGALYNSQYAGMTVEANTADVTFSGNKANGVDNDIYNAGTLALTAAGGRTISLAGGIDGTAGTLNINGVGTVEVANALKNQTATLSNGELHLSNTDLTGSTITVAENATINTIDDTVEDYSDKINLASGANIKGDIDFLAGTADKYAATTGSVKYKVGNLISDIGKGTKDVEVVTGGATVDISEATWTSTNGAAFVAGDIAGYIKVKGFEGGISDAADATAGDAGDGSNGVKDTKYQLTENESVDTTTTFYNNVKLTGDGTEDGDKGVTLNANLTAGEDSNVEINELKLAGSGKFVNNAITRVKNSRIDVDVDNYGTWESDPTTYSGTVNNYAGDIASFDEDTFTSTATLNNAGSAFLMRGVTFDNGAAITGAGTTTLAAGLTHFNNTSNENTVVLSRGATFDGTLVNETNGVLDTRNGGIDSGLGAVTGGKVYVDADYVANKIDSFETAPTVDKINLVNSEYGDAASATMSLGGATLASDATFSGGYYTKMTDNGTTVTFSDKLMNTSGMHAQLGDWTAGNIIGDSTEYTATDSYSMTQGQTVGGALSALDTAIGDVNYSDESAVAGSTLKTGSGATTTVRGALDALDAGKQNVLTAGNGVSISSDTISAVAGDGTIVVDGDGIKVGTVQTANIAAGAVTEAKLADSAVTTDKINNAAVTNAKLAANAVTTDKIADGTITFADLNAGMIADSTTVNLASPSDTKLVTEKAVVDGVTTLFNAKQAWTDATLGITSANANAVNNEYAGTNYLTAATTLTGADKALDTAIATKYNFNAITTTTGEGAATASTAVYSKLATDEAIADSILKANPAYTPTGTQYMKTVLGDLGTYGDKAVSVGALGQFAQEIGYNMKQDQLGWDINVASDNANSFSEKLTSSLYDGLTKQTTARTVVGALNTAGDAIVTLQDDVAMDTVATSTAGYASGAKVDVALAAVDGALKTAEDNIGDLTSMTGAHVTNGASVAANLDQLSLAIDNVVGSANTYTDQRVESLDKNLSAGVAGAVALSSVAVSGVERGEVSVGAGYGYFNGQSAAAFGAAMGLTNRWSVNAGAGISNADVSFRAGTNYKFKLF